MPALPQGSAARAGDQGALVTVECACEHCGQEFSAEPEGGHRLLCGSSTESDAVARLMDDERAMLVATDPPYLVDYKGGDHPSSSAASAASRATKNKDWSDTYREGGADEFFAEFIATGIAAAATLGAPWYIWHADRRVVELKTAMTRCGLLAHQHIIWVKSRAVLTYSHFMIGHESCLYGWLEGHAPPVDRRPPANAQTVWQIDGKIEDGATGVHPTQKPVEIVARPIRDHTKPGELIYEPFSGSGTAFIAAEKEGRRCNGMELSPSFVDVIVKRWQGFTGRQAVLAGDGRSFDAIATERES
jgi:DNA modification methylase